MSCFYANVRSLVPKIDVLRIHAIDNNPSVIFLTETWAHDQLPDSYFSISGYVLYRCDRSERKGGGVMIYIKEDISSGCCKTMSCTEFDAISCYFIDKSNSKIGLACIYRPPSICDKNEKLFDLFEFVFRT